MEKREKKENLVVIVWVLSECAKLCLNLLYPSQYFLATVLSVHKQETKKMIRNELFSCTFPDDLALNKNKEKRKQTESKLFLACVDEISVVYQSPYSLLQTAQNHLFPSII